MTAKNVFKILVLLGLISMNNISAAPLQEFKKPWFTLELTATGVGIDARFNDIHIDQDAYGGHSTTEFELATSVIDGINKLKIIIYPFFKGDSQTEDFHYQSEVKATVYVREKDDPNEKKYVLSHIHINPNLPIDEMTKASAAINGLDTPKVDIDSKPLSFPGREFNKQIVVTRKTLPIKSPYPRWAWQDGQIIQDNKENFDSLLAEYKKLHDAFSNKDKKTLLELHAPRSREYALAYYLGDSVDAGHKFMSTGKILDNKSAKLDILSIEDKKLDIYADGKLARIVDLEYYHPILFFEPDNELIHIMSYGFYKNKNGDWVLIR